MRHIKSINESFGSNLEFNTNFNGVDVSIANMPTEWETRGYEVSNGRIRWTLYINSNKNGIESFEVSVPQLVLLGSFDDEQNMEFELQDVVAELTNITNSFYATAIDIDMKESTDQESWDVKILFGNQ